MMQTVRVDMGTVENGQEFATACQQANSDIGQPGITINPANVGCQESNVVERTIQTYGNTKAAMMVSQDLLGASAWGLLALAAADDEQHHQCAYRGHLSYTEEPHAAYGGSGCR
jgi:hypothetical protein